MFLRNNAACGRRGCQLGAGEGVKQYPKANLLLQQGHSGTKAKILEDRKGCAVHLDKREETLNILPKLPNCGTN